MVLGGHRLCDVDREAEDGWIDERTDARLPHSGQEPTLGPSTKAVGPGVPLHRSELQTKTHPTLFLANRESLFPNCACVSGEKRYPYRLTGWWLSENMAELKRGKQVFCSFILKKEMAVTGPVCEGRGPTFRLAGPRAPRPHQGGPSAAGAFRMSENHFQYAGPETDAAGLIMHAPHRHRFQGCPQCPEKSSR